MSEKVVAKAKQLVRSGRINNAIKALSRVNQNSKEATYRSLVLEAELLNRVGQPNRAILLAQKAFDKASEDKDRVHALFWKGVGELSLNRAYVAEETARKSIEIDSSHNNAKARFLLAKSLYKMRKLELVEETVRPILGLSEFFVEGTMLVMEAALDSNNKIRALEHARRLMAHAQVLEPYRAAKVCSIFVDMNCFDEAHLLLEKSKHTNKKDNWQAYFLASMAFQKGDYEKCLNHLDVYSGVSSFKWMKGSSIVNLKADALDKLGRYDEAFKNYRLLAEEKQEFYNANDKLKKAFDRCDFYSESEFIFDGDSCEVSDHPEITFIVGFPRSGTTLLDTMLNTHDDLLILSETSTFYTVEQEFFKEFRKGKREYKLSAEDILELQAVYFEAIESLNRDTSYKDKKVIVEKMPYYMNMLPLMNLIFPRAKFILSLRHPMDCCLSVLQQNFAKNAENIFLGSISNVFNRYAKLFTTFENYEALVGERLLEVRYEDLVDDAEKVMSELFEFIGVEPTEEFKNFHKLAEGRVTRTASKQQTNKPLYKSSKMKWKNYQEHLLLYAPIIKPFIDKYGYSLD